jgi:hypothetical protein
MYNSSCGRGLRVNEQVSQCVLSSVDVYAMLFAHPDMLAKRQRGPCSRWGHTQAGYAGTPVNLHVPRSMLQFQAA